MTIEEGLRIALFGALPVSASLLMYAFASSAPEDSPRYGARGIKRQQALHDHAWFVAIDPVLRWLGRWIGYLRLPRLRARIDELLRHAGDVAGLSANEFLALALLSSFVTSVIGFVAIRLGELPDLLMAFCAGLGLFFPYARLMGYLHKRLTEVNRSLPTAIDLLSLGMSAGLDFTGALRQVIDKAGTTDDALVQELAWLWRELEFGLTRRQALENFASRVPTEAVQEFVSAVLQAEDRGNPLLHVLRIQADVLRKRRAEKAEELAARAGVMMLGPLVLIFTSILLVLMGPFLINGLYLGM